MQNKTNITPKPEWWPQRMIDEDAAAVLLGISVSTLQAWRCRKTFTMPYVKVGFSVRYNPDRLWQWLCKNSVEAVSA